MRWLVVLLILSSIGCSQKVAPDPTPLGSATPRERNQEREPQASTPTPDSTTTPTSAQEETRGDQSGPEHKGPALRPLTQLQPHDSPIQWPEGELEIAPSDRIVVQSYIGGVAGTDTNQISIFGDGTVIVESGRAGGPGGQESKVKHTITAELTREIFQQIRSSKLLDHTEPSGHTTGASLFVRYNDLEDQVSIPGRLSQVEAVVSKARSSK